MSIAVAVRKQARIALATDSQTNLGSERVPMANMSGPKYMQIGDAYMAATGWTLYSNILADVLARRRGMPRLDSEANIFKFFTRLWEDLHERLQFRQGSGRRRRLPVRQSRQHVSRGCARGGSSVLPPICPCCATNGTSPSAPVRPSRSAPCMRCTIRTSMPNPLRVAPPTPQSITMCTAATPFTSQRCVNGSHGRERHRPEAPVSTMA